MTAIRPERLGTDRTVPEKTGPEVYAPHRKSAERVESEQAAVTAFEGEIREFVRRDVAQLRRHRNETEQQAPEPGRDPIALFVFTLVLGRQHHRADERGEYYRDKP